MADGEFATCVGGMMNWLWVLGQRLLRMLRSLGFDGGLKLFRRFVMFVFLLILANDKYLMMSLWICSLIVGMLVIEWINLVLVLAGTFMILRRIRFWMSWKFCCCLVTANGGMLYWSLDKIMAL